jgi:hypothetical protein
MVLVNILKRRDGSSVVAAVLIALILSQPISTVTGPLAGNIMGLKDGQYYGAAPPGAGWEFYVFQALWAVLQLLVLEILAWIYIWASQAAKKK